MDIVSRRDVVAAAARLPDSALLRAHRDILAAFAQSIDGDHPWAARHLIDYALIVERELASRGLAPPADALTGRDMLGLVYRHL